jgi:hypothetical protein
MVDASLKLSRPFCGSVNGFRPESTFSRPRPGLPLGCNLLSGSFMAEVDCVKEPQESPGTLIVSK